MTGIILDLVSLFILPRGLAEFPVFFTQKTELTRMSHFAGEGNRPPASFQLPAYSRQSVRHILLGDYAALLEAINQLAALGYCDRAAWINPLPTGRSGEYISLMTRRYREPTP